MDHKELYQMIANFGNDPIAIMIYAGPAALFLVFLVTVVIVTRLRRPNLDEIDKEIEEASSASVEEIQTESTPLEKSDAIEANEASVSAQREDTPSQIIGQTAPENLEGDLEKEKKKEKAANTQPEIKKSVDASKTDSPKPLTTLTTREEPELTKSAPEAELSPANETDVRKGATRSAGTEAETPSDVEEIKALASEGWLRRLSSGLSKSRGAISDRLSKLLTGKVTLDDDLLEDIHEVLYRADIGVKTADDLIEHVRKSLSAQEVSDSGAIKSSIKSRMVELLNHPLSETNSATNGAATSSSNEGPKVILIVGVNGVGKTTSIGKLAAHYLAQEKSVLLCAADTFRAAAIDQLKVWADRLQIDIVAHQPGSDPAAVAYDGVKAALSRNADILLIDTAGRLHNKAELMDELGKIKRVIRRDLPEAPHETWIVVDATTGQNASQQVKAFKEVVELSGIIVTKLDGTAKGGAVVGISHSNQLPIKYIGVGEKASDLRSFKAEDFVDQLM